MHYIFAEIYYFTACPSVQFTSYILNLTFSKNCYKNNEIGVFQIYFGTKRKLFREGSFKKNTHICPSGPTGGGVCQNTNLLNRFFYFCNELFELQNKVSIQNILCFLSESTFTAKVGADLFNFGLTVYSTNA